MYKNVKGAFNDLHIAFIAVFGVTSLFGLAYNYYRKQRHINTNNDINFIDLLNTDKSKIRLIKGKKLTIAYGVFHNNIAPNLQIFCILDVSLMFI